MSASFDDPNLVSCAGLVPVLALAHSCGLDSLVAERVSVPAPNARLKVAALVELARRTPLIAAATDQVCFADVDDTIRATYGYAKQGAGYGYSKVKGLNALIATISTPDSAPVIAATRLRRGSVKSARCTGGEEPDADVVVASYSWLLDRVGDGVRLTQTSYLPPSVVTAAMTELGWADDWYGKGNREDVTLPVFEVARVRAVLRAGVQVPRAAGADQEETFTLAPPAAAAREFVYEYDFGDSWHHDIVIEQTLPARRP